MKKLYAISLILYVSSTFLKAQQAVLKPVDEKITPGMTEVWDPEVKIIQPGEKPGDAPTDAIVLFNGNDVSAEWTDNDGKPSKWVVENGALLSVKGAGVIKSKRKFTNFQLHIEWKTPSEVSGESQGRGNSGVFLQEQYEIQVLDSYNNHTTVMVGLAVFTSSMHLLLMFQENQVNGNHTILSIPHRHLIVIL